MATTPTLNSLNTRLTALEAKVASVDTRLKAVESTIKIVVSAENLEVPWRRPQLRVPVWPADSSDMQGSIFWSFAPEVASQSVFYRIDTGQRVAAGNPIPWGPLGVGVHQISMFIGESTVAELTHSWSVLKQP